MTAFQKPLPLDIKCTSVDCDNDLRCFKQLRKMTPDQRGRCRACGADLVDWDRLHRRDESDARDQATRRMVRRDHTSESAATRVSISASLCCGEGVSRSRSCPRGTVG